MPIGDSNWLARESTRDFKLKGGVLLLQRGEKEVPVRVTSPVDIALPGDGPMGDAVAMRYFPARAGATAHMESVLGDGNLDYNDGPNDVPGPDKKEWDKYVGEYSIHYWGKPMDRVNVNRKKRLSLSQRDPPGRRAQTGTVLHLRR